MASIGGSLSYGTATVLEQVSAKREKKYKNINPKSFVSIIKQWPYITGLILDMLGWLLFLVAVRSLPLFLVQSFVATSIIVSAVLDRYLLKHRIFKTEKIAMFLILLGVFMLSYIAKPGVAGPTSSSFKIILIIGPLVVALLATIFIKMKNSPLSTSLMAFLVGLAFGGTTIISRIIIFGQINKTVLQLLLAVALVFYGVLAILILTVALQRATVNKVNSIVLGSEVLLPSLIGLIFLGDKINSNNYIILYTGLALVIAGSVYATSLAKTKQIQ